MATPAKHSVSAALEDYLEVILGLGQEKGSARVRDIAARVAVHKSTVSAALHSLAAKGLVHYSPYELVTLTPAGRDIAREIGKSHGAIRDFLSTVLGLPDDEAQRNACRMEHVVDTGVRDRMALFADFLAQSPRLMQTWRRRIAEETSRAPAGGIAPAAAAKPTAARAAARRTRRS